MISVSLSFSSVTLLNLRKQLGVNRLCVRLNTQNIVLSLQRGNFILLEVHLYILICHSAEPIVYLLLSIQFVFITLEVVPCHSCYSGVSPFVRHILHHHLVRIVDHCVQRHSTNQPFVGNVLKILSVV